VLVRPPMRRESWTLKELIAIDEYDKFIAKVEAKEDIKKATTVERNSLPLLEILDSNQVKTLLKTSSQTVELFLQ